MQKKSFNFTNKEKSTSFQIVAEFLASTFNGLANNRNKYQEILKDLSFCNSAFFSRSFKKGEIPVGRYLSVQLICVLHLEELGWFHRKLIYLLYFPQQKKQFPKRPPLQPAFLPSWIKKAWKQTKTFQNLLITKKPHCISWSDRPPSSQTAR